MLRPKHCRPQATDVEEGSEDNDSIAVSLDALEGCEEEVVSEEED
jgi:hypothetical protein